MSDTRRAGGRPAVPSGWLPCAALLAGSAVLLGAFGAHGLRERLSPALLAAYQTGVSYQFYHALGLLAVGVLASGGPPAAGRLADSRWLQAAGWLLCLGVLLFSGSLYLLALSGVRGLGLVTPFGGVALTLGWLALAVAVWRSRRRPPQSG